MRRAPIALVPLLLFVCAGASTASEIDPDRPDLSSSARTVGRGVFQLEAGFAYERTSQAASPPERRLAVEALIRIGLMDRLELQLEAEPFVRLRGPDEDTGHGDLSLGVKARLWDAPEGTAWPTLGVLAVVKPPIADEPIGTERLDATLTVLASFELPADFSLDANAGVAALGQTRPNGYLAQGIVSVSLSRRLTKSLSVFGEFFFNTRGERGGRDEAGLHTGLVYTLAPWIAVDAAVLTGLMGRTPDYALRSGVSLRYPR